MAESTLRVFDDAAQMAEAAAILFAQLAVDAVRCRGRFVTALSGGGTPRAAYRLLAETPYTDQVPWAQTHLFWGDERLVPPDNPESNYGDVQRILLDRVPIPQGNIHRVCGECDPNTAAAAYREALAAMAETTALWPVFDLALMGIGEDGHTASLFPGLHIGVGYPDPVAIVTAAYAGRPAQRITLTPPVFSTARCVLFLVAGANKAEALAATLSEHADPLRWPARRIAPTRGALIWWVDRTASAKL